MRHHDANIQNDHFEARSSVCCRHTCPCLADLPYKCPADGSQDVQDTAESLAVYFNTIMLAPSSSLNQKLHCFRAVHELYSPRYSRPESRQETLAVSPIAVTSRWALHLVVHIHWLEGNLEQVSGFGCNHSQCMRNGFMDDQCCLFVLL